MMALIEFTEHAYGRLLGAVEGMTEEELLMLRFGAIVLSPKPKAFAYRWWSGD